MSASDEPVSGPPVEGVAASHPPSVYSPPLGGSAQVPAASANGPGTGGPGTGGSGGEDPKTWRWVALALAALVVVLLVAFGAALLVDGREPQISAGATTTTTQPSTTQPPSSTSPSTTEPAEDDGSPSSTTEADSGPATTAAGGSGTSDNQAQLDEIIAFVEQTRGHKFKKKPTVRFLAEGEFAELLLKDFDEDAEEMEKSSVTYRALGFIGPDQDLETVMRETLELGVVGFYDPETEELVVRGTELSAYARTVVAHELTHALDDQYFDLDRPKLDEATDETGYGFTVLVEGSASFVEQAYRAEYSAEEEREASSEEAQVASNPAVFSLPVDVVKLISGPYSQGPELVEEVIGSKPMTALDPSFAAPPISSEQALTPSGYVAKDPVAKVAKPKFEGTEVESGAMGQFVLTVLLQSDFDINLTDPDPATEGWAGDQYVAYTSERGDCVSFEVQMDDAPRAEDLGQALSDWASEMPDAESTVSGNTVSTTSCINPSGGGAAQNGA